ncbi:unnamed protein product [Rhodiola kirilowii]
MQVKVERVVGNGVQSNVICQVAVRLNVDVPVMGSHGYGMIERMFLGSVSNHCAHTVKCPVLIVNRPKLTDAPAARTSS